jgi:hypothetical protein
MHTFSVNIRDISPELPLECTFQSAGYLVGRNFLALPGSGVPPTIDTNHNDVGGDAQFM